jgi:hypothetical protein
LTPLVAVMNVPPVEDHGPDTSALLSTPDKEGLLHSVPRDPETPPQENLDVTQSRYPEPQQLHLLTAMLYGAIHGDTEHPALAGLSPANLPPLNSPTDDSALTCVPLMSSSEGVGNKRKRKSHRERWEERFSELKRFRDEFAHTNVPDNWKENKALATWVSWQRRQRKKGDMSEERIAMLDQLEFEWNREPKHWTDRYMELKMYKDKYKNVNVPARWKDNPQLATWVSIQRTKKKQGRLKLDRVALLNEIGFEWERRVVADPWAEKQEDSRSDGEKTPPEPYPTDVELNYWKEQTPTAEASAMLHLGQAQLPPSPSLTPSPTPTPTLYPYYYPPALSSYLPHTASPMG